MSADRKTDVVFVMAVAAALGLSLLAGLTLAPRPLPPPPPPARPPLKTVPPGYDPYALDGEKIQTILEGLSEGERGKIEGLVRRIDASLGAVVPDVPETERAVLELAALGEKAAPSASRLLADPRPPFRRAGARLAGHIGSPLLVPILCPLLEDGEWEVQADAAWALGNIGDRSAVIDLLKWRTELVNKPRHYVVKIRVAEALLRLGNTSGVDWLIDAVIGHSPPQGSPVFEGSLATAALREQSGRNFGFDRESYRNANESAGKRWARWWTQWSPYFVPPKASPDRTSSVRLTARVLEEMKDLEGLRYYLQYFGRLLLARTGALALDCLLPALYAGRPEDPMDPSSHLRLNASETLRMMVEMKLQPAPDKALLAPHMNQVLLHDGSAPVRAAAARCLALLGDRRSVAPLLDRLSGDGNLSVRIESARALGELAFTSTVPELTALRNGLESSVNPVLRFEVEAALLRCGGKSPLDPLVSALEKAVREKDRSLCEEVLARLGELTGRRCAVPSWGAESEALVTSWKRHARFHVLLLELIEAFLEGEGGAYMEARLAVMEALLGPEVPSPPADPRAALDHFLGVRDLWRILARIRNALEANELAVVDLLVGASDLARISGRPNAFHPRLPKKDLTRILDLWTAWAERNGPGCLPGMK